MDPTRYEAQTSFCMVWFMLPYTPQGPCSAAQLTYPSSSKPHWPAVFHHILLHVLIQDSLPVSYLSLALHCSLPVLLFLSPSLCPSLISIRLPEPTFQGKESIHIVQGSWWRERRRSTFSSFLISPLPITFHLIQEGTVFSPVSCKSV